MADEITVPGSSPIVNPVQAAATVLAGFAGGYFVKAGLITDSEAAVVVPAVLTVAYAAYRAVVSHLRAKKAVALARNADIGRVK